MNRVIRLLVATLGVFAGIGIFVGVISLLTAIGVVIIIELIAFTGVIPAFWGAILQEVVDMITISLGLLAKTKPSDKQFGLEE